MTTIGRVDFTVDFDGKTLPQQAKLIGQRMGQQLSRSMQAEFDRSMGKLARDMSAKMDVVGKKAGREFSNALQGILRARRGEIANTLASMLSDRTVFDNFVKNSGSVREGLDRVSASLERARDKGIISENQFKSMNMTFKNWGGTLLENERNMNALNESMRRGGDEVDRTNGRFRTFIANLRKGRKESNGFLSSWKQAPHGLRQFAFYFALFASLGSEIAILGSAAGSGLTILLGSVLALLPAIAAFGVGIAGIAGDISKVPAAVLPVRKAFESLGDDFAKLRDDVTVGLFSGLEGSVASLADTLIPTLNAGLVLTAQTLNEVVGRFLEFVQSAPFLEQLNTIFTGIQPIITLLLDAFGKLALAITNVFTIGLPYIEDFAGALNDLFGRFLEWTQSAEGIQVINEWLSNGQRIFTAILPLISAAAGVLNGLVTPQTISLFEKLMENLTTFLSIGGSGLLNFLAVLDPIGLIAQALADLSVALQPAQDEFMKVAEILNGALSSAISTLAPMIGDLVVAFAPLLVSLVQMGADILASVLPALQPLIAMIVAAAPQFIELANTIITAILPAIIQLVPAIVDLAVQLIPIVIQLLPSLTNLFIQAAPLILGVTQGLIMLINSALVVLIPILNVVIGVVSYIIDIISAWTAALGALVNFVVNVFRGDFLGAFLSIRDGVVGVFNSMASAVENILNGLIDGLNNLLGSAGDLIRTLTGNSFSLKIPHLSLPRFAAGAFVDTPTRALIGENGPEAVVPLRRPLGAVSPDVRGISAVLQGKPLPNSGGGDGPSVIVEEGAIQIVGVRDESQAANAALDRLVARVGG